MGLVDLLLFHLMQGLVVEPPTMRKFASPTKIALSDKIALISSPRGLTAMTCRRPAG